MEEAGSASADKLIGEAIDKDFVRAEQLSLPITIGILLAAFGALLAAIVPVALAMTAIFAATGLLAFTSHLLHVDSATSNVMLLIGLAVGVDYSLFYIMREREERARGRSKKRAIEIAAATSGRAVLISGITVIVAMAGMFLTGNGVFMGFAEGTILVVLTAVVGSLTVLPALLSLIGDRIDARLVHGVVRVVTGGRVTWRRILGVRGGESRVWGRSCGRCCATRSSRCSSPAACSWASRSPPSSSRPARRPSTTCRATTRSPRRSSGSTRRSPAATSPRSSWPRPPT